MKLLSKIKSTFQKAAQPTAMALALESAQPARNPAKTHVSTLGKIKFYDKTKNFGFIKDDSGTERFFHTGSIKEPNVKDDLVDGTSVKYTATTDSNNRPIAISVQPVI